jgi:hypothetical protein
VACTGIAHAPGYVVDIKRANVDTMPECDHLQCTAIAGGAALRLHLRQPRRRLRDATQRDPAGLTTLLSSQPLRASSGPVITPTFTPTATVHNHHAHHHAHLDGDAAHVHAHQDSHARRPNGHAHHGRNGVGDAGGRHLQPGGEHLPGRHAHHHHSQRGLAVLILIPSGGSTSAGSDGHCPALQASDPTAVTA